VLQRRQARGAAEAGQAHRAGRVDQDVAGLEVLVDEVARVQAGQRDGGRVGQRQPFGQGQRLAADGRQRHGAGVGQHQGGAVAGAQQRQRLGRPLGIELGAQRVFVLEAGQAGHARVHRGEHQHRRAIRQPQRAAQHELAVVA
jgi:hypothetical protein